MRWDESALSQLNVVCCLAFPSRWQAFERKTTSWCNDMGGRLSCSSQNINILLQMCRSCVRSKLTLIGQLSVLLASCVHSHSCWLNGHFGCVKIFSSILSGSACNNIGHLRIDPKFKSCQKSHKMSRIMYHNKFQSVAAAHKVYDFIGVNLMTQAGWSKSRIQFWEQT